MRGTLSELLKVMVYDWFWMGSHQEIDHLVFLIFSQEFSFNQDWKTQTDCKVTRLWLQSHKSQVCDCNLASLWLQSHKKAGANATQYLINLNYSTRMIVVRAEPTEPYGGISARGLSESKLCVRLERIGVQSMWLHATTPPKKIKDFLCLVWRWLIGWFPPHWLIRGTNAF